MEIHRHPWFKEQRVKGGEGMPRFSAKITLRGLRLKNTH